MGAVVVFSGGQDSTTCLLQALAERGAEQVACLTFAYGQRHTAEVDVAKAIVRELGITRHKVVGTDWFQALTQNALLDTVTPIKAEAGGVPNTFVPGRNAFFLLAAAVYARELGWREIVTGVCEVDSSGYPDCRAEFITAMNEAVNRAMDLEFRILAPLMHLTKAQTWALADILGQLEFVRRKTLTCYEGVLGDGCGKCPACVLRARGLNEYLAQRNG